MRSPMLRLGPLPPLQISPGTLVTVAILAVVVYPTLALGPTITSSTAVLLSLGIALFMIASVLVHEAAHALSAHAFGATVDHIALTLWGGHTQYRGEPMGVAGSVVVSLSGPASNALLAAGAAALAGGAEGGSAAAVFWGFCSWLNVALAVFNLLPGLPMDGGRALESLLGAVLRSPVRGTRITAWIGRLIAVAVVLFPITRILRDGGADTRALLVLLWAVLIASMLWHGASRALEGATLQHRIDQLDAQALSHPMQIVPPTFPVGDLRPGQDLASVLILDGEGAAPGTRGRGLRIHPAALEQVPADRRDAVPVSAIAGSLGTVGTLELTLRGQSLLSAMLARPHPAYLVLAEDGSTHGVLLSAEVNTLLRGR